MRKFNLMLALCLLAVLAFAGCKSTPPPEDLQPVPEALDDPNAANGMGSGATFGPGGAGFGPGADADGWIEADPTGNRLGMPIVYFAYDSDLLVASESAKLDAIADYMSKQPGLGLVFEGHCDQRGTDEYNRALGERRANAIRAYIIGRGIADGRLKTVSYGKDKPAVSGSGESIWSQNRRGVPVPMKMPR